MNLLKKMISVILLLASCLIAANVPTMSLRELKIRLRFCQAQVCFEMNSTAYSTIWHVSNRVNLNFRLATNVRKQWNMGLQQQSLKGWDNFEYNFNFCPSNYRRPSILQHSNIWTPMNKLTKSTVQVCLKLFEMPKCCKHKSYKSNGFF